MDTRLSSIKYKHELFVPIGPTPRGPGKNDFETVFKLLGRHRIPGTVYANLGQRPGAAPEPGLTVSIVDTDDSVCLDSVAGLARDLATAFGQLKVLVVTSTAYLLLPDKLTREKLVTEQPYAE